MGELDRLDIFIQPCENLGACRRGDGYRCQPACPRTCKVNLQKEVVVFNGLLILVMTVSGLHIELDQLENEVTI